MSTDSRYLLDSDVLITAKNSYYAFDICPGFWSALLTEHGKNHIFSIDRVKAEILAGSKTDSLFQWVENDVPKTFFLDVDEALVIQKYADLMLWAKRKTQYSDKANAKFATGADAWLIAYASVHGFFVVTNETPDPNSKREIKLPDAAATFDVKTISTFDLLRTLNVQLR